MTARALLLLAALAWPAVAWGGPPAGVTAELGRWLRAVESGDPERVAALLPEGAAVVFETEGALPGTARPKACAPAAGPESGGAECSLDAAALREALRAGQGDALGLDRGLLLPRARSLTRVGEAWEARDPRCPEVRWVFERHGKAWRLARVVRVLLEC